MSPPAQVQDAMGRCGLISIGQRQPTLAALDPKPGNINQLQPGRIPLMRIVAPQDELQHNAIASLRIGPGCEYSSANITIWQASRQCPNPCYTTHLHMQKGAAACVRRVMNCLRAELC